MIKDSVQTKPMEFKDILSVALATLIVLVVSHFAVFWVVRTLYPPIPAPQQVIMAQPPPIVSEPVIEPQTFTQPSVVEQHVTLPTYETSVPLEAARQEGGSNFSDLQSPPVQRDPGMAPLQS